MRMGCLALLACAAACTSGGAPSDDPGTAGAPHDGGGVAGAGGAGGQPETGGHPNEGGAAPLNDDDGDGIDDARESQIAADYLPFLSIHPDDGCPLHGVVYRLSPHPAAPQYITIWYDVLYQRDCGLNGHVGDNEVFSVLLDPRVPAPEGILAVRAISHQDTLCERVTTCGRLAGCAPCAEAPRGGAMYPVVFSSKGKHGGYVDEGSCDASFVCDAGGCSLAAGAAEPPLVNAGEPAAPLVTDLTAEGFIGQAAGWTEPALWAFNPWGAEDFGSAGNVADDLQDPAFVVDPAGCP